MAIRHVQQSDWDMPAGHVERCGPACVAMIAGVSEARAIQAAGKTRTDDDILWWPDVKRALDVLGVSHDDQARRITNVRNIRQLAIIECQPSDHYVVYDPSTGLVHDPLKEHPQTVSSFRLKPKSYLAVGFSSSDA